MRKSGASPEAEIDNFCRGGRVKTTARAWTLVLGVLAAVAAGGCGSKKEEHGHAAAQHAPEPPPPTPDFTPITTLRTPAGLVLKPEGGPPTESPGAAPATPLPSPIPGTTP
jgi:hypothetical protein